MRELRWFIFLAGLAGLLGGCGSAAKSERVAAKPEPAAITEGAKEARKRAFIWKAKAPVPSEKVVYLLGSVHAGNEGFYPLDPVIEDAYAASDTMVVEVNLAEISKTKMQEIILLRARLPPNQTLREMISEDTWDKLNRFFKESGISVEMVSRFKPWFAAVTIVTLRFAKKGFSPEFGVDQYFINKGNKEIIGIESADFQLSLFDDLPDNLEELLLLDAIEGPLQVGGDLEKIMDAWQEGDKEELHNVIFGLVEREPRFKPLFDRLIVDRNKTMAEKIEKLLQKRKTLFVVVGAGHIIGADGLVEIFKRKGYGVEQLYKQK